MANPVRSFIRQAFWIVFPAVVFFLTGALAVWRQGQGYRLERSLKDKQEEVHLQEAIKNDLQRDISFLTSRGHVTDIAVRARGLHQPSGSEITILKIESRP